MTKIGRDLYPPEWQPSLLHHFFLQHSKQRSDQMAIISEHKSWTYSDLHLKSLQYAEYLWKMGVKRGDRVVLISQPTPESIALIIACSLAGAVYVPIDPDFPFNRKQYIIKLVEPSVIILQEGQTLPGSTQIIIKIRESELICLSQNSITESHVSYEEPVLETDLAYIIFTSGSTGKPKGIMISHRAALAFFRGLTHYCDLSSEDRIGTIAPLHFDFSLLDMALAFGRGSTLVQIPRRFAKFPRFMIDYLIEHSVTQLNCVPTVWKLLLSVKPNILKKITTLRQTLYAGERFSIRDIATLQHIFPQLRIINCFGHSETIACSFDDIPNPIDMNMSHVSIGKGHPGIEMLLFNENLEEIHEAYVAGELYLRGASLFSGYWRDDLATNQALVNNFLRPFTREKIFKTGDLAYKDENGNFYFVGRQDFQIKISGHRIELEEVERVLQAHEDVLEAVVIYPEDSLVAYLIINDQRKEDEQTMISNIRKYCADHLPVYMIPTKYLLVKRIPRLSNGKVDRQKIREAVGKYVVEGELKND